MATSYSKSKTRSKLTVESLPKVAVPDVQQRPVLTTSNPSAYLGAFSISSKKKVYSARYSEKLQVLQIPQTKPAPVTQAKKNKTVLEISKEPTQVSRSTTKQRLLLKIGPSSGTKEKVNPEKNRLLQAIKSAFSGRVSLKPQRDVVSTASFLATLDEQEQAIRGILQDGNSSEKAKTVARLKQREFQNIRNGLEAFRQQNEEERKNIMEEEAEAQNALLDNRNEIADIMERISRSNDNEEIKGLQEQVNVLIVNTVSLLKRYETAVKIRSDTDKEYFGKGLDEYVRLAKEEKVKSLEEINKIIEDLTQAGSQNRVDINTWMEFRDFVINGPETQTISDITFVLNKFEQYEVEVEALEDDYTRLQGEYYDLEDQIREAFKDNAAGHSALRLHIQELEQEKAALQANQPQIQAYQDKIQQQEQRIQELTRQV